MRSFRVERIDPCDKNTTFTAGRGFLFEYAMILEELNQNGQVIHTLPIKDMRDLLEKLPEDAQTGIAIVVKDKPAPPAVDILAVQQKFIDAGYQWEEHVYNDGIYNDGLNINCSIQFTKDTDPFYFSHHVVGDFGWGRFSRESCWGQANTWLEKLGNSN